MFQVKEFKSSVTVSYSGVASTESSVNRFLNDNKNKIKKVIDIKYSYITQKDYLYTITTLIYEVEL